MPAGLSIMAPGGYIPAATVPGPPGAASVVPGPPGPPGPEGPAAPTRVLIEVDGVYPARPDPDYAPVLFVGATDPTALMIVGDAWQNTDADAADGEVYVPTAALDAKASELVDDDTSALHGSLTAAYVRHVSPRAYGGKADGVADDAPAIQAAADACSGQVVHLDGGNWRIASGVTLPAGCIGITGDGLYATTVTADLAAGGTAVSLSGASRGGMIFRDFSIVSSGGRTIERHGLVVSHYAGHNVYANVRVYGFNGAGVSLTAIWDSVVTNLIVEECGNAANYAFSVNDGTNTANHTVFTRVQVEKAHDLAMYAEGLSNTYTDIHTEGLVRDSTVNGAVSHVLRGAGCTYDNLRAGQDNGDPTTALMRVGGDNCAYRAFRLGATDLSVLCQITGAAASVMTGSTLENVSVDSQNVSPFRFEDSGVRGTTTIPTGTRGTIAAARTRFSGNLSLANNNTSITLNRCTLDDGVTVTASSGNPSIYAYDTSLDQPPAVALSELYNCEIRNTDAQFTRYAGKWHLFGGTMAGATIGNDLTQVHAFGTLLTGSNYANGSGNPTGAFLHGCRITGASPAMASRWQASARSVSALGGAAATTLGTLTKKVEVFDASGASLGWLPIYDNIT